MSFLGGVNLGKPSDRVERMLRAELELRRERWQGGGGYVYRGGGDLLLREGRFYTGRILPDQYQDYFGPPSLCFQNALDAALEVPELRYCEGVYMTGHGYATGHAWCVAPDDGVVELTFPTDPEVLAIGRDGETNLPVLPPEHWGYWGVTFTVELVIDHNESRCMPMLDRSPQEVERGTRRGLDMSVDHDYPVLKVPYNPDRKSLT